jgi:hypothetical protein
LLACSRSTQNRILAQPIREVGLTYDSIDLSYISFYDKPLVSGASLYFTTQLVGVPKNGGPPIPLPFIFTWTDNFNGTTGGINLLSY